MQNLYAAEAVLSGLENVARCCAGHVISAKHSCGALKVERFIIQYRSVRQTAIAQLIQRNAVAVMQFHALLLLLQLQLLQKLQLFICDSD